VTHLQVELKVGACGPVGFELRVGDRRVPFGFDVARELVADWPGRLGALAAQQAAAGGELQLTLGCQTIRLSADEARQLAVLPSRLGWLLNVAAQLSTACQGPAVPAR